MRLRSEQYEKRIDEMNRMTGVCDFGEFVGNLEDVYNEEKKRVGQFTERTKNVLGEKFSLTFQNKYAQLSTRFDSLIQKAQLNFITYLPPIQDLQQPITLLLPYLPNPIYPHLLSIISHILLFSQSLYHHYIKQQVLTIKEQLQTIVLKNYQLEEQITNVYELYEEMKEKLDDEGGYRVELERHLTSLEREILCVRQENYELGRVNKQLVESKHELDEVVQVTKLQQTTLKTSHLLNTDRLKQQQNKLLSLTKQNETLHHQLLSLRHQLQQAQLQHQNFIEQINNLKQALDNRNYELDIYRNRQLRDSPSNNNLLSHDKLQNYRQLVLEHYQPRSTTMCYYPGPCYNLSSEKSSLRSFMLSHQKSMGKLTIFETREQEQRNGQNHLGISQRMLEKVSSCRKSLHSFERENNNDISGSQCDKQSPMRLGFVFPLMNQLTFRPVLQTQIFNQKQDKIWTQKRRSQLKKCDAQQQQPHFIDTQPQHHKKYTQTPSDQQLMEQSVTGKDYPYIQPLLLSGGKASHKLSRSKSIADVHCQQQHQQPSSFSVSKRLIYQGHEGDDIAVVSGNQITPAPSTAMYHNIHSPTHHIINSHANNNSSYQQQSSHYPPLRRNNCMLNRTSSLKNSLHHHHSQQVNIRELLDQIREIRVFDDGNDGNGEVDGTQNIVLVQQPLQQQQPNNGINNNCSMMRNKSHSRIVPGGINECQNRSETNSVNRALIKKSIKAQREVIQLIERLQKIETKNDEYSYKLAQLQYKLNYYKQQLSKSSLQCINQKATVQKRQDEIGLMNEEIAELQERLRQCEEVLREREHVIEGLEGDLMVVQTHYEERLSRVKQYCREYIGKRHQQEVKDIVQCYEQELRNLTQQVQLMTQNHQQPKAPRNNFQSMTNIPHLALAPSITNISIYDMNWPSSINKKIRQSITIQSLVVDVQYNDYIYGLSKLDMKQGLLDLCSQCINVVIEPNMLQNPFDFQGKLQEHTKMQVLKERFCLNSEQYSLSVYFPQHKSPSLQKKLLNTPSTTNNSQQTNPTQFPHTPFIPYHNSPQQHPIAQQDESFHTVISHTIKKQSQLSTQSVLQASLHKDQPMQSFFTCIQFSNESIIQMKRSDSNSSNTCYEMWGQQLLSEDILVVAGDQGDKCYRSLTRVQVQDWKIKKKKKNNKKDLMLGDAIKGDELYGKQNKTETKQQSCEQKPSRISQFIEIQQDSPIIRSRTPSNLTNKSSQPFNKLTMSGRCVNAVVNDVQLSEDFYLKSFEKHLAPYFKKHTNFLLSDKCFSKGFIPDVDKIYILHCVRSTATTSQVVQDSDKENDGQLIGNECFLFYNRLLVNLQSGKKLQLPKSSMLKFITDESRLALGNFQITITSEMMLKVYRRNKRCSYMGSLQDGVWQINRLQEIVSLPYSHKK